MQRKNNILKSSKNGFAMIMAIMMIVIISTILALSVKLTSQTVKNTTDVYLYEQVSLYAKSAAEYALLKIAQDNSPEDPCDFNGTSFTKDGIYDINITARYIYSASTCNSVVQYATVTTPEQNGSVLLDITVSVPTSYNVSSESIRYFKRTIQKL
jgi:Tfp pilus assembly protein PilX